MKRSESEKNRTTRLAPSPTGKLHLGNARTFLINWALAQQRNWRVAVRIDDLDSPRVKAGADQAALADLRWLGLNWDGEVHYQSQRLKEYDQALIRLAEQGQIYPCRCTRSQIASQTASAPNEGDHELRYPGTCRPEQLEVFDFSKLKGTGCAWRLRVDSEPVTLVDEIWGLQKIEVDREVGDFLVANKQGIASYQLAVNFDDRAQMVTDVVRGDDLLTSTARQLLIRRAVGMEETIRYWHLPLVVGPDGLRLAKRHGDTQLSWLRDQGVPVEKIVGLLAYWSGSPELVPMSTEEFVEWFRIERFPRSRVTFTRQDQDWLLG